MPRAVQASLEAARSVSEDQSHASSEEQIFCIWDHLYLGTEFGATSHSVFEDCRIGFVINLTNGKKRVPNHFEEAASYVNYELADQPGENIMRRGIREGTQHISRWLLNCNDAARPALLVHCMAGLSRSATVIIAWLMSAQGMRLKEAVAHVTERRGRTLHINPSFWMVSYLSSFRRPAL